MKILLIDPPVITDLSYMPKELQACEPKAGIAYLAGVLEKEGYEVKVAEFHAESVRYGYDERKIRNRLKAENPDIVGISVLITDVFATKVIIKIIREELPNAVVILGGAQISAMPKEMFNEFPEADFLVIGEGEAIITKLIKEIKGKKEYGKVNGIAYKKDGKVHINPRMEFIKDLDTLPYPAWHLFDFRKYRPSPMHMYSPGLICSVTSSRGCPFNCAFCDKTVFERMFRARSAEKTVEELKILAKFKVRNIIFNDDAFATDKKRVNDICSLIRKEKLDLAWSCKARADSIEKDMLINMKRAGCKQISFGIESGSERILKDIIGKQLDLKKARENIRLVNKTGIETVGFFMLGFPTETKEEMLQTINTAIKLGFNFVLYSITTPLPNTRLWGAVKDEVVFENWEQFTPNKSNRPVYVPKPFTQKEILDIYSLANKKFYLRPRFFIKSALLTLKNPYNIMRFSESLIPFLKLVKS